MKVSKNKLMNASMPKKLKPENKPVKKREFDKMVKAMLKVPAPKSWRDTEK